jgi:hypothetical protein
MVGPVSATAEVFAGLGDRALAGVGRFVQYDGQHIADAARLEIREQRHFLAGLIDRAIGARRRRRQHARHDRIGLCDPWPATGRSRPSAGSAAATASRRDAHGRGAHRLSIGHA